MGPRLGKGFEEENQVQNWLLQHPDVARGTAAWFESVGGVLFFDKDLIDFKHHEDEIRFCSL